MRTFILVVRFTHNFGQILAITVCSHAISSSLEPKSTLKEDMHGEEFLLVECRASMVNWRWFWSLCNDCYFYYWRDVVWGKLLAVERSLEHFLKMIGNAVGKVNYHSWRRSSWTHFSTGWRKPLCSGEDVQRRNLKYNDLGTMQLCSLMVVGQVGHQLWWTPTLSLASNIIIDCNAL